MHHSFGARLARERCDDESKSTKLGVQKGKCELLYMSLSLFFNLTSPIVRFSNVGTAFAHT